MLTQFDLEEISQIFGPVRWVDQRLAGFEGWLLIEVNPIPYREERAMIISDIEKGQQILVENRVLRHFGECTSEDHNISDVIVNKIDTDTMKDMKCLVAIHPGTKGYYHDQPIVVPINPSISHIEYPEHPHLNFGGNVKYGYCPDSICYTDNPRELGEGISERVKKALAYVTIWLFRHQIWLQTRQFINSGIWIGPQMPFDREQHAHHLNPRGRCWCGSKKIYSECHMMFDKCVLLDKLSSVGEKLLMLDSFQKSWKERVLIPHRSAIKQLSSIF